MKFALPVLILGIAAVALAQEPGRFGPSPK